MSKPPSRPSTPHRRSVTSHLSASASVQHFPVDPNSFPLDSILGTSALPELSDGLADLDNNLQHLQLMHESINSFNESFSAFLYGIQMNAWCVEFPQAPNSESFNRKRDFPQPNQKPEDVRAVDIAEINPEVSYMTNEASFVVRPLAPPPRSRIPHSSGSRSHIPHSTRSTSFSSTPGSSRGVIGSGNNVNTGNIRPAPDRRAPTNQGPPQGSQRTREARGHGVPKSVLKPSKTIRPTKPTKPSKPLPAWR